MSNHYLYRIKDSTLESFRTISSASYNTFNYGDVVTQSLPLTSSVTFLAVNGETNRKYVRSLRNTLNYYLPTNQYYDYSYYSGSDVKIINISSIFFGSSIKKGTLNLKFGVSGSTVAELQDIYKNGQLIQTSGSMGSGSTAGVVLYNEGIVLITGSWQISNHAESYGLTPDNARWTYYGDSGDTMSSSYDLDFEATNYMPTMTLFCDAKTTELNYSNNPTFIKKTSADKILQVQTSSNTYIEREDIELVSIEKSQFENYEEEFKKQTYISKIGIYDENKKLIAVTKLATPVRKTEIRDLTFKIKIDF